jgi:RNA polymerase sigma-B factor
VSTTAVATPSELPSDTASAAWEAWTFEAFRAAREARGTRRAAILEDVIRAYLETARKMSRRFRHRGVADEDLEQVASVTLVQVVHSYDVDRGTSFLAYAVPSIRGALKRHFRDCGWTVRPPRRVQEMQQQIREAEEELTQRLARSPRTREVAAHLRVREDDVIEALAARGCFTPTSLDRPLSPTEEPDGMTLGDTLAGPSRALEAAQARAVLSPVLATLNTRDRRIVQLRFFEGRTQQEIGDAIGVTQMQVSRLLAGILRQLRDRLSDPRESTL